MSLDSGTLYEKTNIPIDGKPQDKALPSSLALWMAAIYVALFIIRPWEQLFPTLAIIRFERIYGILMIVIAVFSADAIPKLNRQGKAVLFFFTAFGICAMLGVDPVQSWDITYKYITLIAFFLVMVLVIKTPYELMFMAASYLLAMGLYLGKSLWEYFIHGAGEYEMGVWRLTGIESTFGDPNSLAPSILYSLPILVFFFSVRREFYSGWHRRWQKLFTKGLVVYAAIAILALVLTRSRGGAVGLLFFIFLLAIRRRGFFKKGLALCGIAVLCLVSFVLLPEDIQNRFRTIWTEDAGPANAYDSARGRWSGFLAGLEMWKQQPLVGVGPGNFVEYRAKHVDGEPFQAHNLFGQMLGETGLLGGVAFLFLLGALWRNYRETQRFTHNSRDPTQLVLGRFVLACRDVILLLLFSGLHGHNLYRFNWLWVAAFCSLAVGFAYKRTVELQEEDSVNESFSVNEPEIIIAG